MRCHGNTIIAVSMLSVAYHSATGQSPEWVPDGAGAIRPQRPPCPTPWAWLCHDGPLQQNGSGFLWGMTLLEPSYFLLLPQSLPLPKEA